MSDAEPSSPPVPPEGQPVPEAAAGVPTPAARAFVCWSCRKGKLDPAGKQLGEDMICPLCGKATKVTLEHAMGEEAAARRQKAKETAKKDFDQLSPEEKLELIAKKGGLEQLWYFLKFQLGPRGMVALYLVMVVLFAAALLTYLLTIGGYEMRSVSPWTVVAVIVGGAVAGFVGWFVHGTAMYYYKKKKAQAGAAEGKGGSARRRVSSVRAKPASGKQPLNSAAKKK